jgi:predicted transcriptional regulator
MQNGVFFLTTTGGIMASYISPCRAEALRNFREKHKVVRNRIAKWAEIDGNTLYRYETARSPIPRYVFHLYRYYVKQQRKGGEREAIE